MTTYRVYVPLDSSAQAMGAEKVARQLTVEAAKRGEKVHVVRNGSRGMYWLEPMVEVETPEGRVAYGPVQTKDIPALFDAGFLSGGKHALSLGLTEEIPYLKKQERLTFARVGITDPFSVPEYVEHGGFDGL
jgi:formate dehydrogenase iron-sulfur subunit